MPVLAVTRMRSIISGIKPTLSISQVFCTKFVSRSIEIVGIIAFLFAEISVIYIS